jgi:hypothetical protein
MDVTRATFLLSHLMLRGIENPDPRVAFGGGLGSQIKQNTDIGSSSKNHSFLLPSAVLINLIERNDTGEYGALLTVQGALFSEHAQ